MTDESEKKNADEASCSQPEHAFPIRDLPDLRRLRRSYSKRGDSPMAVDSAGNHLPHDREEDFGLQRTTEEEAAEFLRELIRERDGDAGDDPLTEFLKDG